MLRKIPMKRGLKRLTLGCATIVVLGFSAVVIVAGLLWWEHARTTVLPQPTGPYAVGREEREWADASRADPLAESPGVKRELSIWIWYPVDRGEAHAFKPAPYVPPRIRQARERWEGFLMRDLLTRDLSKVRTHTLAGATLTSGAKSFPVILFSPGIGAYSTDYTTLLEDLASHGYVVVAADRPYSTSIVLFRDGRRVRATPAGHPAELAPPKDRVKLATRLVGIWSDDLSFELNRLAAIDRNDPDGRFTGRLDLAKVGVFGHSFGGAAAADFCRRDPRCVAGVDIDGRLFGEVAEHGIAKPFLFLLSDHRGEPGSAEIDADLHFAASKPPNRPALLEVPGTRHFNFSDQALLKEPHVARWCRALGPARPRRALGGTAGYLEIFFATYLKGKPGRFFRARTGEQINEPKWFVMDKAGLDAIKGMKPGEVCFDGTPPKLLEKKPMDLPPDDPLRATGGSVIIRTVIGLRGRIVKAKILKGMDRPALRKAVIDSLRGWRFKPARKHDGRLWPVYKNLAINVLPGTVPSR